SAAPPARAGAVVAALLVALTLAEQGENLPLRSIEPPMRVPPELAALARAPGRFAVLDLPYDSPGHPAHRVTALAMLWGAAHERPIFCGLYPRAARGGGARRSRTALFGEIHRIEAAVAQRRDADPPPADAATLAAARQDLADLQVGAILLHDLGDAPADV